MTTNKEKERRQWAREYKAGKKCETCGSEFALTIQHTGNTHMNRSEKKKHPEIWKDVRILCETCHFMEDHKQMMRQAHSALMRRYEQQCQDLANRYGWKKKEA